MKRVLAAAALAVGLCATHAQAQEWTTLKDMVSPVGNPTLFEDPRQTTEIRPFFAYHDIQDSFATGGGDVELYQLQGRFKLNDRFSVIVTKFGLVDFNADEDTDFEDDTGFSNLTVGGKYTLMEEEDSILTGGLRYEIPLGSEDVAQGEGDGLINPFLSYGWTRCQFNLIASAGLNTRFTGEDSNFYDVNIHTDYKLGDFYPLLEWSLIHVFNDGNRIPIDDEGADFFDFGSSVAAGTNVLTMGVGARYRFDDNFDGGLIWQFPMDHAADGTDFFNWRITADVIYRFEI